MSAIFTKKVIIILPYYHKKVKGVGKKSYIFLRKPSYCDENAKKHCKLSKNLIFHFTESVFCDIIYNDMLYTEIYFRTGKNMEMIKVKKRFTEIAAMVTALCCMVCSTSCGREVPTDPDTSNGGFVAAGGGAENTEEENDDKIQLVPRTTTAADISVVTTDTTGTGKNVSLVTRSKEELEKINNNKKPRTTVKVPSGVGVLRTTSVKNNSGTGSGTGTGSGGNGTGTGTGTGTTASAQVTTTAAVTTPSAPTIQLSYTSAEIIVGQTKQYALVTGSYAEEWTTSDANVATVDQYGNITAVGEGTCKITVTDKNTKQYGEIAVTVINLPDSLKVENGFTYTKEGNILIANKSYALPSTYNPGGLTDDTYNAFLLLKQAAANANCGLREFTIASGYRSYTDQIDAYNSFSYDENRDTFSARPGHSEHQTGMAIDVIDASENFNGTPEAEWLKEHCHEYGFIIRYPEGKEHITGYMYEAWHIRYVGVEMAQKIREEGERSGNPNITLEEYFDFDSDYR